MTVSGVSLVDANIWLALVFGNHVHHQTALVWFEGREENSCAFCRVTQLALLRHLTNSRIMAETVQTQFQAWRTYHALANDPRVIFIDEPRGLAEGFEALTQALYPGHAQWTDAYLVAFARAAGLDLTTFDANIRGVPGTSVRVLVG